MPLQRRPVSPKMLCMEAHRCTMLMAKIINSEVDPVGKPSKLHPVSGYIHRHLVSSVA